MSTFTPIDPATATGQAAELLAQVRKALGLTPNMTKVMANSPVLPAAIRERLAITTAEYNGCEYCLSAHTYIGANIAKVDADELELARTARSADPHVEALLTLSDTIARNHGQVGDADLDAARRAGVTDAEMGEVVANLALNVLTNYFNILAGVENDWPVVVPARPAA